MSKDIGKRLKNEKGITTIEVMTFIAVAAIIAYIAIPQFRSAFFIRSEIVTGNFNSIDTIIE